MLLAVLLCVLPVLDDMMGASVLAIGVPNLRMEFMGCSGWKSLMQIVVCRWDMSASQFSYCLFRILYAWLCDMEFL